MPDREYTCAECGGVFVQINLRGRPRVCCEDCAPIRAKRQIAQWNRDQTAKQRRTAYERNSEAIKARATKWNREHPERRSQITRAHYANTREARQEYGRRWRESNRDKTYAYSAEHHARRRGALEVYAQEPEYMAAMRNDPCSYCGGPGGEVDHITAVSQGGSHDWTNLTGCCRSCNPSKRDNALLFYLIRKG